MKAAKDLPALKTTKQKQYITYLKPVVQGLFKLLRKIRFP